MVIQVVGSGCRNCKNLLAATEQAVEELKLDARIEYVTDLQAIAATGVLRTPGLVVDGRIVSAGRVLGVGDVKRLLAGS